jgi:hypothetical protein
MMRLKKTGIAISFVYLCTSPAQALDEIYSPNTEYREISLEYNGSRTFDSDPAKDNAQSHEFAIEAGVLPHLMVEASGSFEKDPGEPSQFVATEVEGRYQFFDTGEKWLDSGLLVAYGYANHKEDADDLEVKLLLQKDIDKFTATANIGFEQPVGHNAEGGPDYVLLLNARYRVNPYFQPGIELQSDLGVGQELRHFSEQEHYLGPAVYGQLFGDVKYQAGYFVGLSDASAQSAGRVLVEYEMHF